MNHRVNGTDGKTVSAVQAVLFFNEPGFCIFNTACGTDLSAGVTADAFLRIDPVSSFVNGLTSKAETLPVRGQNGKVKVLPFPAVQMENFQGFPALN